MKTCSAPGCENPHSAKGYCTVHYNRLRKKGSLDLFVFEKPKCKHCDKKGIYKGFCVYHYNRERLKDPSKRITKEDNHKYHIKHRYGISKEQYDEKLRLQDNKCAICNKEEIRLSTSGEIRKLSVDHDHDTNEVRDLLCYKCNWIIGVLGDNLELLEKVKLYLIKHRKNDNSKRYNNFSS